MKWSIKELIKLMILEILKQYVLLVMKLEIMLLVWIKQILNKIERKLRSDVLNSVTELANGREMVLTAFKSGIFQVSKESQEGKGANEMSRVNASERLKILTPNQMLKRLPITLAQVKAGNNSESLLNEIRQIVYSLYRSKETTKKVYNNIINSIKV